jgi:hypothetical protein
MASISIPNLVPVIALAGNELLEVVQAGTSSRATVGQIAALATGGLNPSLVLVATATETIGAGAFVNLYATGGGLLARNAIATGPATFANSFSLVGTGSGNVGLFYCAGLNFSVSVPLGSGGSEVWLSDVTPGGYLTSHPNTQGHIIQSLGVASPGAGIFFSVQPAVEF